MIDKKWLGAKLRARRLVLGMTMNDVARAMQARGWTKTTPTHVGGWEGGHLPSWERLVDLREILGLNGDPPRMGSA